MGTSKGDRHLRYAPEPVPVGRPKVNMPFRSALEKGDGAPERSGGACPRFPMPSDPGRPANARWTHPRGTGTCASLRSPSPLVGPKSKRNGPASLSVSMGAKVSDRFQRKIGHPCFR